jgi:thiamine biosynthesis lipoprotein
VPTPTGYHHVEDVMGMAISIDVHDDVTGTPGLDEVITWLHHVDATFSPYRLDSAVSRLGLGELTLDEVDTEVAEVLIACERLRVETGGAFDAFSVPAPNGSHLDPSGYVKGWAVQRAADLLEAAGLRDLCINAGGDIVVRGGPRPDPAWRVGLRSPSDPNRVVAVIEATGGLAVATSATYERGAHIVDPRTGQPAGSGLASLTVLGADLGVVDAYATAAFVVGDGGLDWVADRPDVDGVAIDWEGHLQVTASCGAVPGGGRWRLLRPADLDMAPSRRGQEHGETRGRHP